MVVEEPKADDAGARVEAAREAKEEGEEEEEDEGEEEEEKGEGEEEKEAEGGGQTETALELEMRQKLEDRLQAEKKAAAKVGVLNWGGLGV